MKVLDSDFCVMCASFGAQLAAVFGGSSSWDLPVIGQLLLYLLRLVPHSGQEVRRGLWRRHGLLHVVVQTFPHSARETILVLHFDCSLISLCYKSLCSIVKVPGRCCHFTFNDNKSLKHLVFVRVCVRVRIRV